MYFTQVFDEGNITNEAEIKLWEAKDVQACSLIYATVNSAVKDSIINCGNAHQMWQKLSTQYMQNATDSRHILKQQFFELKFDPKKDIASHINEIECIVKQLKDIGEEVEEIDITNKIICMLPQSFRNFITVWDAAPENDKTLSLLTSRLLKEERMNKRFDNESTDLAYVAGKHKTSHNRRYGPYSRESNDHQGVVKSGKLDNPKICAFCVRRNFRANHPEERCWYKQAYQEGFNDGRSTRSSKIDDVFSATAQASVVERPTSLNDEREVDFSF